MRYTLVKPDGTIGATRDFDVAPTLAPNKGKWLPDNPPAFNPATHVRNRAAAQSVNAPEIAYRISPRPPAEIAAEAAQAALQAEREDVKQDAFTQAVANMTKAEVLNAADTALAELPVAARNFIKKLALLAWIDAKEKYKD